MTLAFQAINKDGEPRVTSRLVELAIFLSGAGKRMYSQHNDLICHQLGLKVSPLLLVLQAINSCSQTLKASTAFV